MTVSGVTAARDRFLRIFVTPEFCVVTNHSVVAVEVCLALVTITVSFLVIINPL